jgi:prevent-host-death family protein
VTDKKYILKIEGQELTVPPEVGGLEDADLKRALTPMFPGAANSKIERTEKDDTVTITGIKLAGSKGNGRAQGIHHLAINPLCCIINTSSQTSLLRRQLMNNIWQLQEAKSKFSEVVDRALAQGVQIVTRRGKRAVVVMPFEEYERLTHQTGSLAQFLLASPLSGSELAIERDKSLPRTIEIEP